MEETVIANEIHVSDQFFDILHTCLSDLSDGFALVNSDEQNIADFIADACNALVGGGCGYAGSAASSFIGGLGNSGVNESSILQSNLELLERDFNTLEENNVGQFSKILGGTSNDQGYWRPPMLSEDDR